MYTFALPVYAVNEDTVLKEACEHININHEIERALNGITDVDSEEIMAKAVAFAACKDGTKNMLPVDVYVTTRKIAEIPARKCTLDVQEEAKANTVYATTAVAVVSSNKSVTDSKEKSHVTATITLYWTDNFGIYNELESVTGGWKVAFNPSTKEYPYLTNRSVYLYANQIDVGPRDKRISVFSNEFEISGDVMPSRYISYSAESHVEIYDSEDAANDDSIEPTVLELRVSTPLIG